MFELINAAPDITQAMVTAAPAATSVTAQSFTDWADSQITDFKSLLKTLCYVIAIVIFLAATFAGKFGIAKMLIGAITAGLFVYIAVNLDQGDKPNELIDEQFDEKSSPAIISPAGFDDIILEPTGGGIHVDRH